MYVGVLVLYFVLEPSSRRQRCSHAHADVDVDELQDCAGTAT
jgi:hypothetical protein